MAKSPKDKPLPKPPSTPFGRKKSFEHPEEAGSLTADRMAEAMAEGKLDEFLKKEMPDNEYARNLATMMMGMTGMIPAGEPQEMPSDPVKAKEQSGERTSAEEAAPAAEIPDDVRKAVMSGDVNELMGLLRREQEKRAPNDEPASEKAHAEPAQPDPNLPKIDKNLIEALVQIAQENSVSLDWIILRAIKLYVQEYQKTGKL